MSHVSQDTTAVSANSEGNRVRRGLLTFAAVFIALYAPFAWLLYLDFTTNNYHFQWLCLWPVLPGLVAGLPFKAWYDDPGLIVASGAATLLCLALLTLVGTRYRSGLVIAVVVASVISIPTSFLSWWLFRN